MAAPTYQTDLTTLTTAETLVFARNTSTPFAAGGNISLEAAVDFAIQGTNSNIFAGNNRFTGLEFDAGATVTMTDSDHIYQWVFIGPAGLTPTLDNQGTVVWAGSGNTTDRVLYNVFGNDTYGAGGRNNLNFPYNYRQFQASVTNRRTAQGTPGANPRYFGIGIDITATTKGQNCAADALRWGRGHYIQGGDGTNGFANFAGLNTFNDSANGRYGVFNNVGGTYELQGLVAIGRTRADVSDSCAFVDENSSIVIPDLLHCSTDFSQIYIDGTANSITKMTAMSMSAQGTLTRGIFKVANKDNTVTLTRCNFNDIGETTLSKSTTVTGTSWTGCDTVFQDSATISGNFIETTSTRAAIVSENPTSITSTSWTSPGTGHGIELTLTGSYNADDWQFTGYFDSAGSNLNAGAGSTNAALYNNSGGAVTINLVNGSPSFSVRNGTGATTTIVDAQTVTVSSVLGNSEVQVLPTSGSPYSGNSLNDTLSIRTESVSADTITGDGTNYVGYVNNTVLEINTFGTSVFSGVLTDGDISSTPLANGDFVRVTVRDDADNPTLQLSDVFEVNTASSTSIVTKTTFAGFTSKFGTVLNSSNSKTVTVEKVDARYQFSVATNSAIDLLVFRTGSNPILFTGETITADNRSFPATQTGDRNYINEV